MGRRKITATVLTIVLLLSLTACGRGKEREPVKLRKSGVRAYRYSVLSDGTFEKKGMILEYEDIGTERSKKKMHPDGTVTSLVRWYYDNSGEHLLKMVSWNERFYTASTEYDLQGRKIVYSLKNDQGTAVHGGCEFPDEYRSFFPYDFGTFEYVNDESQQQELNTKYTYEGDTDKILTMETFTESGSVVGLLERGDGDIILRFHMTGIVSHDSSEYDESYDAVTGQSQWTFNVEGKTESYGVKTFDDKGRCVSTETVNASKNIRHRETYRYEEDGSYKVKKEHVTADGGYLTDEETQFSSKGKCINSKSYYYRYDPDTETEEKNPHGIYDYEYEYYDSGNLSKKTKKYYDSQGELYSKEEKEYDEAGNVTSEVEYIEDITMRSHFREMVSVPGVAGDVMRETHVNHSHEETYERTELYQVMLSDPDAPWEQCRITYSKRNPSGEYAWNIRAEFDEQGRVRRIEDESYSYIKFFEYDEQGRVTKAGTINKRDGGENGTLFEYWEEE